MRTQAEHRPAEGASRPTLRSLEAVDRALLRATTTEIARLESRVAFLATTNGYDAGGRSSKALDALIARLNAFHTTGR